MSRDGEHKAAGVDELLRVLKSDLCVLEEFDLSGNLFSEAVPAHVDIEPTASRRLRGRLVPARQQLPR